MIAVDTSAILAIAIAIVARLAAAPDVAAVPFEAKHYAAAEVGYERFGK